MKCKLLPVVLTLAAFAIPNSSHAGGCCKPQNGCITFGGRFVPAYAYLYPNAPPCPWSGTDPSAFGGYPGYPGVAWTPAYSPQPAPAAYGYYPPCYGFAPNVLFWSGQ